MRYQSMTEALGARQNITFLPLLCTACGSRMGTVRVVRTLETPEAVYGKCPRCKRVRLRKTRRLFLR
jgi:hypothetical protein